MSGPDAPSSRCALLTGATGYIGSRLVRGLLAHGWRVHVVVREGSKLAALGVHAEAVSVHVHDGLTRTLADIVARVRPDTVFHLASLYLTQHRPEDVKALVDSNLLFATQLAEAMAANGAVHLVNTGTAWQHHGDAGYNPVNLYAATKQAFEDILAYYVDAHGLKATTLVLSDTYGPDDPRPKLVPLLWRTARTQEPLLMSPGGQEIDLVHVDDVSDAFLRAAELLPAQRAGHARYAVSSGRPLRLVDLVAAFEAATGLRLPITWGGRPYREREVMHAWRGQPAVPGWQARIPFEVGVLQARPPEAARG